MPSHQASFAQLVSLFAPLLPWLPLLLLLLLPGGVWFSRYPSAIAARRSCMIYGIRAAVPWNDDAPDRVSHIDSVAAAAQCPATACAEPFLQGR